MFLSYLNFNFLKHYFFLTNRLKSFCLNLNLTCYFLILLNTYFCKRLISFLPELNDINFDKTLQIKKYNKPITNMNNEQINRLNKTNINAINIHYDKSVMDYLGYSNI